MNVFYDLTYQRLVDEFCNPTSQKLTLYFQEETVMNLTLFYGQKNAEPSKIPIQGQLSLAIDVDWNLLTPPIIYTNIQNANSDCVAIPIQANTLKFKELITGKSSIQGICQIKFENPNCTITLPVLLKNIITMHNHPPVETLEYYPTEAPNDGSLYGRKNKSWISINVLEGPAGPQGSQGVTGDAGPVGALGPQGPQGIQGERGADGAPGIAGENGAQGLQGDVGPVGAQGLQGLQGERGADGAPGPQGLQGIQGERGADGAPGGAGENGAQGLQGVKGDVGPVGAQGPQGPQGEQGSPGEGLDLTAEVLPIEFSQMWGVSGSLKHFTNASTSQVLPSENGFASIQTIADTFAVANCSGRLFPQGAKNGTEKKMYGDWRSICVSGGDMIGYGILSAPFSYCHLRVKKLNDQNVSENLFFLGVNYWIVNNKVSASSQSPSFLAPGVYYIRIYRDELSGPSKIFAQLLFFVDHGIF